MLCFSTKAENKQQIKKMPDYHVDNPTFNLWLTY